MPSGIAGAGQRLGREVDQTVAAADDERLDAVGDAGLREVESLVGVAPLEVADDQPGVAQAGQRRLAVTWRPSPCPRWDW